jgi:hypothetical protein
VGLAVEDEPGIKANNLNPDDVANVSQLFNVIPNITRYKPTRLSEDHQ